MSTATAALAYRKTKQGEWVVFGPKSALWDNLYNKPMGSVVVTKKDGSQKTERIARLGKSFQVDGTECCYGYIDQAASAPAGRRSCTCGLHRSYRECRTGGNCSSFGDGRSCGGCDCDGY